MHLKITLILNQYEAPIFLETKKKLLVAAVQMNFFGYLLLLCQQEHCWLCKINEVNTIENYYTLT